MNLYLHSIPILSTFKELGSWFLWPLGIIENLIVGSDGVARGAKLRAGKSYVERAIKKLYPLELSCDRQLPASQAGMNPEAAPFRPKRDAAVAARLRLQEITQEEV